MFKTNTTNITDITNTSGTRRFSFFGLDIFAVILIKASLKGALVKGGTAKAFGAAGKSAAKDIAEEGIKKMITKPQPRRSSRRVRGCFSADTFVVVCDRSGSPTPKPISSVEISEEVLTSKGCSPVYLMGHETAWNKEERAALLTDG